MNIPLKITCCILLFTSSLSAQDAEFEGVDFEELSLELEEQKQNYSFKESLRFGGGIGLSFGNDYFSASLSPFMLSQVNEYVLTGIGLNFSYASFDNQEDFVYGGSLMVIGQPITELQISAEFEQLRVDRSLETRDGTIEDKYWYPALFLGLGYSAGPATFGLRWDVLYDDSKSIYASSVMPFVRFFF